MIHVVLLTCDRREYTSRTIDTFIAHNPGAGGFTLWHCDDASTDPGVRRLALRHGFAPLIHTDKRVGVTEMVRRTSRRLAHEGAEWMLLLENDWETVRAFPWPVFDACLERGDIWSLRLYGKFKERGDVLPAGTRHRGRNGADPKWETLDAGEPFEVGDIHWGNPPSVSKVAQVAWLHKAASREKDAILRSGQIADKVARVSANVVYHMGFARTPGFKS